MKKFWKHKSKFAAIALVLLMASVTLTLYNPVQAQYTNMQDSGSIPLPAGVTPDARGDTFAGLSVRPNPVGIGQTFLVNLWIIPSTDVARYLSDFKVTITKPDETEDVITLDGYYGDQTAWFEYVADQTGNWKLKFDFPGGYFPAGNYTRPEESYSMGGVVSFESSFYFEPSSTPETILVVQEEGVASYPPSPLPTDYWTRPVSSEHREWWPILGNYPWHGPAIGGPGGAALWDELYPDTTKHWNGRQRFTPWVEGPNTAHVAWKRLDRLGGIIGGDIGQLSVPLAIIGFSNYPRIIYNGRCYQGVRKAVNGEMTGVWLCYDLRTGEIYWENPIPYSVSVSSLGMLSVSTQDPNLIEYYIAGGENPGAQEWIGVGTAMTLVRIGGGRLIKYDPLTGAVYLNVSIAPVSSGTYYRNGYALSLQNIAGQRYLINWTTFGRTANFTERIVTNITWPWTNLGSVRDFDAGIAARFSDVRPPGTDVTTHVSVRGASLKTGTELWNITVEGDIMSGTEVADHGKVAFIIRGSEEASAYNLNDGSLAWKSDKLTYPWSQWLAYSSSGSAYGMIYECGYDGIYAINWDDGTLAWKYEATTYPYASPYTGINGTTVFSFGGPLHIADGKVYAYNSEHTVTQPITRGWGLHCIDAFTGEGIWNMTGVASPGPVADGYLTAGSLQTGHMYVFGKGKSATTVTAPKTEIPLGQSVMLTGTVLDLSPGQPGTPCVSKESMSGWMEYLHVQMPMPADVTGVPVSLDIVDPNGNFFHIADVTTDGYSGTFGYAWTPEIEGTYSVMANFAGDESYGSSFAQTYVNVGEAAEPYPEPPEYGTAEWPEYPEAPTYTAVDLAIIVAIAVVALLVLYTLWTVRKR